MTSAACDSIASDARNAAINSATRLVLKICSGSRVGCSIASPPPATTARLRITLWRGGGRRCWRGALVGGAIHLAAAVRYSSRVVAAVVGLREVEVVADLAGSAVEAGVSAEEAQDRAGERNANERVPKQA